MLIEAATDGARLSLNSGLPVCIIAGSHMEIDMIADMLMSILRAYGANAKRTSRQEIQAVLYGDNGVVRYEFHTPDNEKRVAGKNYAEVYIDHHAWDVVRHQEWAPR